MRSPPDGDICRSSIRIRARHLHCGSCAAAVWLCVFWGCGIGARAHDGPPYEYDPSPVVHSPPGNNTCFNEDRVWANGSSLHSRPTLSGKFTCPEANTSSDLTECCGPPEHEYCCSPWDSVGMKWGIGIGITVAIIILMALGYTVQLFRACDRCYHEFPIIGEPVDYQFAMDTRWYSVSHEGNRYGVTFHSKQFASHFMQLLESCYGPWNAANILRIRKDDQDFVVLHIFFNDFFTPWFYTQGPIKNDEEWIRSDFKDLCFQTQCDLAIKVGHCCTCCPSCCSGCGCGTDASGSRSISGGADEAFELIIVPPQSPLPPMSGSGGIGGADGDPGSAADGGGESGGGNSSAPPLTASAAGYASARPLPRLPRWSGTAVCGRPSITSDKKDHRPWTKHTFKIGSGGRHQPEEAALSAAAGSATGDHDSAMDPPWQHQQRQRQPSAISEDCGNEKGTQTLRVLP